jgi:transposase
MIFGAIMRFQAHWRLEGVMARKTGRAALRISEEERGELEGLAQSRTAARREVERAGILLRYADGEGISDIERALHVSRPTIYKCIDKALAAGVRSGLKDRFHRPREAVIIESAKAWVIDLACRKPCEMGLAAELWTLSELARYARKHAPPAGHASLAQAGKATIWRILNAQVIKPHRIQYYLEQRDPQFEDKMREVLLVYQEVALQNAKSADLTTPPALITVSLDEKPGVQAIENTAPDLPPQPRAHPAWSRDHEYIRHGTLSILAALDLHDGHIIAQVHPRHRSREHILLLKELDAYYPPQCTIRVILDNHSSHISKETMTYLATRPNRFVYVHTPKHGSWLNLIEMAFSKMARSFLRRIRVRSRDQLKERILKGVAEMNESPTVMRWRKFDLGVV